ncbi:MAG: glycosyltransferase family 4 protein [Nanoarchaeota archaeon]|nr:glycosyltransferase family 4 protein [Nanoarchaeota archaeon]
MSRLSPITTLAPFYPVVVQRPREDFFSLTKELTDGPIISAQGKSFLSVIRSLWGKNVHAHGRGFPFPEAAALFSRKAVYTPHNDIVGSQTLARLVRRFLFNRYEKIVCQTTYGKESFIKEGLNPDKLIVIPSAVDYEFFSQPRGGEIFRKRFGLGSKPFAISIGIRPLKHPDVIVDACKQAGIPIVFIGPATPEDVKNTWKQEGFGWYIPNIEALKQDHVIFAGQLSAEEVLRAFDAATLYINSSLYECFGLAVYEAAASGLPLCLPDYRSFDGFRSCALFHPCKDSKVLAENIRIYLDNHELRKRNGKAAKQIAARVDYSHVKEQFEVFYAAVFGD